MRACATSDDLQALLNRMGCCRVGKTIYAPCPNCQADDDRPDKPSLMINPGEQYLLTWFCFNCMIAKPPTTAGKQTNRMIWGEIRRALQIDPHLLVKMSKRQIDELWEGISVGGEPVADEAERAPDGMLHLAYDGLLSSLSLSDTHRKWLDKKGLDPDVAYSRGYRSGIANLKSKSLLTTIPGLSDGRWLVRDGALLIPCRDRAGLIGAIKQRVTDGGRARMRLLGGGESRARQVIHFPVGSKIVRGQPLVVTEGECKADIAHVSMGYTSIVGLPGVGSWSRAVELGIESGCVLLALDQDDAGRKYTGLLGRTLSSQGVDVRVLKWANVKGLDDAHIHQQKIDCHEWSAVQSEYLVESDLAERELEDDDEYVPPFTRGQKLKDWEIVPYVEYFGPVPRSEVNGYSGTISQLIRENELLMTKDKRGQVLSAPAVAPGT